jgi:hypothetical protein
MIITVLDQTGTEAHQICSKPDLFHGGKSVRAYVEAILNKVQSCKFTPLLCFNKLLWDDICLLKCAALYFILKINFFSHLIL